MACHTPEGAAGSTAPRYRVYDPLRDEWAMPHPAAHPMTAIRPDAALHDSEQAAVMHGRQLIGPVRPWLVVQPVCPICEGAA